MLLELLLFLVSLGLAFYFYLTRNVGYFRSRGVLEIPSIFPWGSEATKLMYTGRTFPYSKHSDYESVRICM